MGACIPKSDRPEFNDRDFQTIGLLFPDIFNVPTGDGLKRDIAFHVVPGKCDCGISRDNIFHEDVWNTPRRLSFYLPDISRYVTMPDGKEKKVDLEIGWGRQRASIFGKLEGYSINSYDNAGLFGALYGTAKAAREILMSANPQKKNVKAFLVQLAVNIQAARDDGDILAIFYNSMDWKEGFKPVLNAIRDLAENRGDTGTAEFTGVTEAANDFLYYRNAETEKKELEGVDTSKMNRKRRKEHAQALKNSSEDSKKFADFARNTLSAVNPSNLDSDQRAIYDMIKAELDKVPAEKPKKPAPKRAKKKDAWSAVDPAPASEAAAKDGWSAVETTEPAAPKQEPAKPKRYGGTNPNE